MTHKPHKPTTARHSAPAQERKTSTQRGYGYKWQQARAGYLAKHPLCVNCSDNNRVAAATDVDHIKPHRGDMQLFWDRSNWQGLCHPCHSAKTAREDGGFGNQNRGKKGGGGSDF
ncbi:HNH endonuclease signature motif containing protein [Marinobacter sp. BGYM27]|uniref:HNH endonuclease n=1 Tax=Marinobacter sp. BGYM27 TaxID=2975597 RepID=UPI0021A4AB26|nr:HNH endonuclease signature motif containing protein [Marinobacter sp. BGYM27]MDG5498959.1 HNH endonuclease signature motif containing protein [Marinobacter sp. BGYM27]